MAGKPMDAYKGYRSRIQQCAERQFDHTLGIYDVVLKFLLEAEVKRIVGSDSHLWEEAIDFGNIPDAWIQFNGGEAFIEVDRGTERPIVLSSKCAKYIAFNKSGGYRTLFPGCGFKVLVFTTTEERIESLEQIVTTDDIWFCTMEEFLKEQLNHAHWFALRGFYALPVARQKEMQELQ